MNYATLVIGFNQDVFDLHQGPDCCGNQKDPKETKLDTMRYWVLCLGQESSRLHIPRDSSSDAMGDTLAAESDYAVQIGKMNERNKREVSL